MTIYNINFRLNWRNSGIEYAQQYRANLFRQAEYDFKFIYTDVIDKGNLYEIAENMGFEREEVVYMHQSFSDIPLAPSTYTLNQLRKQLDQPIEIIKKTEQYWIIQYGTAKNKIKCHFSKRDSDYLSMIDYWQKDKLFRRDYYSNVRTCSEYYHLENGQLICYYREFYNQNGTTALREYADAEESLYVIGSERLYGKSQLFEYFMEKLALTSEDIILVDRSSKIAQSIVQCKGQAKLGVVIHAEHYNKKGTSDNNILWNNHYEYVLSHARYIDFFITATEVQKELLSKHLLQVYNRLSTIYAIPVGSLDQIYNSHTRKPYSIITASRLAYEKHIDWLVEAVWKAKKVIPDLSFDIYGEGAHRPTIVETIKKYDAQSFITLKGHQKLETIYQSYELFVAASTSEGFGLTLMEAVGSGLAMIGLDVNYGNPTFIQHERNGYLIPYNVQNVKIEEVTDQLAAAIIKYFNEPHDDFHKTSYAIAECYTTVKTVNKWHKLIEEVTHD